MNEEAITQIAIEQIKQLAPGLASNLIFMALGFMLPTLHELLDTQEAELRGDLQLKAMNALRGIGVL